MKKYKLRAQILYLKEIAVSVENIVNANAKILFYQILEPAPEFKVILEEKKANPEQFFFPENNLEKTKAKKFGLDQNQYAKSLENSKTLKVQLEEKLQKMNEKVLEYEKEVKELKISLEDLKKINAKLFQNDSRIQKEKSDLERNIQKFVDEKQNLTEVVVVGLQMKLNTLTGINDDLEKNNKLLKFQEASNNKAIKDLEGEIQSLKNERKNEKQIIKKQNDEIKVLLANKEASNIKVLKDLEGEIQSLKNESENHKNEKQIIQKQNEEIKVLLVSKDLEICNLEKENKGNIEKISAFELEVANLEKHAKLQKSQLLEADEIISVKDREISEMIVEKSLNFEKIKLLESENSKNSTEIEFLTKEIDAFKIKTETLQMIAQNNASPKCANSNHPEESKEQRNQNPLKERTLDIKDLEILEPIGEGSFGTLYLATDKIQRVHKYAIKTIPTLKKSEAEIEKEITIWKKIQKSERPRAIPRFYNFFREEIVTQTRINIDYHLIFDYFPHTLRKTIQNLKKAGEIFPLKKLFFFSKSLIRALAYLQAMDVCHRDLKPDNLLLDEACENIFIIDFGESKEIKNHIATYFATLTGTPKYLSPELYKAFESQKDRNFKKMNLFKSDVFALGLILLELGALKLPKRTHDDEDYAANIEKLILSLQNKYKEKAEEENLENEFEEFLDLLNSCLIINRNERLDFVDLFLKMLALGKGSMKKMKKLILICDQDVDIK